MFLVCGEALFDFFLETEDGPGGGDLRGAGRRLAVQRGDRAGAAGAALGPADRALHRPARPAADAGCWRTRASRPPTPSRPTGRPRSAWSGSTPPGVPAYQFYDNGSADTGVTEADLPALGPEISGLHFGSYSIAAAPVGDALAALAARPTATASSRSIPTCARRSSPTWTSGARGSAVLAGVADMVKISAEDLELLHPGHPRRDLRRRPDRRRASSSSWSPTAARWRTAGAPAAPTPPRARRRSTVIDTVGAGDTFQAALIAQLLADRAGPQAALDGLDAGTLPACSTSPPAPRRSPARAGAPTCRGWPISSHKERPPWSRPSFPSSPSTW